MSTPRVTIVGGGSTHWTPRLLVDFANTEALQDTAVTLMDVDPGSLPLMAEVGAHIAKVRGIGLSVRTTTDLGRCPGRRRRGDHRPIGGGLRQHAPRSGDPGPLWHPPAGRRQCRARAASPGPCAACRWSPRWPEQMERHCPEALLVNVSNPLTALCRAAGRESSIRVVGLCNELVGLKFSMSLLFDAPMHKVDPVAAGVNHFPLVTELRIDGADGFAMLRSNSRGTGVHGDEPIWMDPVEGMHWRRSPRANVDQGRRGGQQPHQARALPALRRPAGLLRHPRRRVLRRIRDRRRPTSGGSGASTTTDCRPPTGQGR